MALSLLLTSFNSSLVRLIADDLISEAARDSKFQFQFGTIDREIRKVHDGFVVKFQFQFGTIDSRWLIQ